MKQSLPPFPFILTPLGGESCTLETHGFYVKDGKYYDEHGEFILVIVGETVLGPHNRYGTIKDAEGKSI
jgi:hypothetical protein